VTQGAPPPARRSVRRRILVATPLLGLLFVLFGASPSSAHTGDQSYLYVDVTESSLSGRVEIPFGDLEEVLGLDLDGTDEEILAELQASQPIIADYLADHMAFGPEGTAWPITYGEMSLFESEEVEESLDYALIEYEVAAGQDIPRAFDVTFDPFLDEIDGRDHLMLIQNDWRAGVFDNGNEVLLVFDGGSRTLTADLGDASQVQNLWSSVKLGIKHIETGPDHILFVLVLLLPSVLVWKGGWKPTDSFGSALWRILKIVTMFTIAHSITFSLAGLGILPLPSPRIVESIIALSIAIAAIHNIRPLAANQEWLISFVFGLFHGMGFASLVSELDVSRGTQLVSLLGRNIGIEIGQAVVVLVLFPALFLLRRLVAYRPLFVGLSILLSVVAVGWAIERAFEVDLSVDSLVDPVFVYPRIFVLVAIFTAAAAALYYQQKGAGRLLPTVAESGGDGPGPTTDELKEPVAS
ncbi:MAG: HupE/UreJ family protein, partial [Actinomycetota bacterium]